MDDHLISGQIQRKFGSAGKFKGHVFSGIFAYPARQFDSTDIVTLTIPEGTPVTEELAELVADGQEQIFAENCSVYPVSNARQPVCAFFPILREGREPLALLLCSRTGQHLSEMEFGCAKLVAAVIANKIK